ncbi:hypothetical protein [Brevundimonas naejangsanensis]|uniref:hypothetical protein n=1 Tax=Brevundimonas naejangsanensis TaxID=588932 RepID=UPI0026E9F492|nr:hypothetical protein [Brevundimonas naejangsanensis]
MSQPANIQQQMDAARHLVTLVHDDLAHPGTAGEAATSAIMGAIKRCALAGVDHLPTTAAKMEAISYVCAFLGEFIGFSLRSLPPSITGPTLQLFAQELTEAFGPNGMTVVVGVAGEDQPQHKEPVH